MMVNYEFLRIKNVGEFDLSVYGMKVKTCFNIRHRDKVGHDHKYLYFYSG
jgi:hypothetical protein